MNQTLTLVIKQWIARAVSLAIIGPTCARIAHGVLASDGTHQTTLLTGGSISTGFFSLITILALVGVMGIVIGRLVDRREGMLNIAFALGWVAWNSGRLGEVYRIAPEPITLIKLSIESLIIMVGVLLALALMTNPSKGLPSGYPDAGSRFDLAAIKGSLGSKPGRFSLLAGILGAFVMAVLFARTDLPGQAVGVGFGCGILAGIAGTLGATTTRGDDDKNEPTPLPPMVIAVLIAGVLAPLIGVVFPGAGKLMGHVFIADLPGFLVISPMAWAMGALLGVPVGHSWVEHSAAQAANAQTKTA